MNLKNNKHLKEVELILDNWDENKGYLTTNDIQGVDLIAEIDIDKLEIDYEDKEEIAQILEEHYEGSDYYFRYSKDDYIEFSISISTCEEIFVTYDNHLIFPDGENSIKLSRDNQEIEIIAYSLQWMHEKGCFCSIYTLDYYGSSPSSFNIHDTNEYKAYHLDTEDDKKQKELVEELVELIEFQKELEDRTLTVADLPDKFFEILPTVLKDNDGYVEVMEILDFDPHTLEFEFELLELDSDEEIKEFEKLLKKGTFTETSTSDCTYKIKLNLLPNSVRFIMGLDDNTLELKTA